MAKLIQREPLRRNKVAQSRIESIEQAKVTALDWELEKTAEALGLPAKWFTEPNWWDLIDGATQPAEDADHSPDAEADEATGELPSDDDEGLDEPGEETAGGP